MEQTENYSFELLSLYIQKHLGVVTTNQNWSTKHFAFKEYLCRTSGNCCKLYGKVFQENIEKCQQLLILRIASEHNCDSIRTYGAEFKKFQWHDIRSG